MASTITPEDRKLLEEWAKANNQFVDQDPGFIDDNKDHLQERIEATLARMSRAILNGELDADKGE